MYAPRFCRRKMELAAAIDFNHTGDESGTSRKSKSSSLFEDELEISTNFNSSNEK
jgi:hypothetical protein